MSESKGCFIELKQKPINSSTEQSLMINVDAIRMIEPYGPDDLAVVYFQTHGLSALYTSSSYSYLFHALRKANKIV